MRILPLSYSEKEGDRMNSVKRYRIMLVIILLLLLAAGGFYMWSVYVNQSIPEDGTLVKAVETCLEV